MKHTMKFHLPLQCLLACLAAAALSSCATRPPQAQGSKPRTGPSEDVLRLQLFLDAQNFGPGVIDGHEGEFTGKALALYQSATGLSGMPDVGGISPYTTYTVTAEDLSALGVMADSPAELARQSKLPYTELGELLAERFHTTQQFLADLNPGRDINALPPGEALTVPNVARPFRFDQFPSRYTPSGGGSRQVLVGLSQRMLQVMENGHTIAAFPITPGSSEHPAPRGQWKIAGAVPWPWYRYDEGVLKRGERTEDFYNYPPGPNSPVGILWAGLNRPGVGIHGTLTPDTIGRAGSHGCIRLSNWDAAIFYTLVSKGTPVTIE